MQKIPTANGLVALLKNGVIRYKGRDIVMVLVDKKRQPFYKSTGRNSHKPDTWLPFDGVMYPESIEWFDKQAYGRGREHPLHRYGTEELKQVSDALAGMEIPQGTEVKSGMDVNFFLGVLEKYASDSQRQAWARNQGWGFRGVHQKQR